MTSQLDYKVRYSSPCQPYQIHRDTVKADSLEQVLKMFDGLRIIEIDPVIDPEYAEAILAAFELDAPHDPRTVMELRSNVISEALKGDDLSTNERAELWAELAEIAVWLQKDDQQLSDIADARLCARFGTQL